MPPRTPDEPEPRNLPPVWVATVFGIGVAIALRGEAR
jgi:hypothetical protein